MSNFDKIIKSMIKSELEFADFTRAKVIYVDENKLIAEVVDTADESAEYDAVIKSISGTDTGIIPIPKINSIVMIGFADKKPSQAFIAVYDEIEKYLIKAISEITFESNGHSIKISENGIEYIDSNGEAMVLGEKLKQYLSGVDTTLNAILTWAATGVPPNGSGLFGGIAPLAGVTHNPVSDSILSQKGKIS
ncbi:MAG: hypothetical protein JW982_06420 [Spirochaetes bacterium]|nr:hypothetical protein [Spirochaetota bacterium]